MSTPASVPFLLRRGLVSEFVSAVRVPGAPLQEAVREWQNTTWATSFPVFALPTQAPGVENKSTLARNLTRLPSWKSWFWKGRLGEGGFRGPRATVWELFSPVKWPLASQDAVTWRFSLWETGSGQGHLSNDHCRVFGVPGSHREGQSVQTVGKGRGRKGSNAK